MSKNNRKIKNIRIIHNDHTNFNNTYVTKINPITLIKHDNKQEISTKYQKYMYIPPIGITAQDILNIYKINSIDDIIALKIQTNNVHFNRILNCWIRVNFDTLQLYNKMLEKIYLDMIKETKYLSNIDIDLTPVVNQFIEKWLENNKPSNIRFNLFEDLFIFIDKKYN